MTVSVDGDCSSILHRLCRAAIQTCLERDTIREVLYVRENRHGSVWDTRIFRFAPNARIPAKAMPAQTKLIKNRFLKVCSEIQSRNQFNKSKTNSKTPNERRRFPQGLRERCEKMCCVCGHPGKRILRSANLGERILKKTNLSNPSVNMIFEKRFMAGARGSKDDEWVDNWRGQRVRDAARLADLRIR